ncbi:MAG TPA: adenosylcobinamide amidohydrolase [Bacillales bacterium]|nr:adenosylcobinamide amidohydrolase [Bacillales bacterium]
MKELSVEQTDEMIRVESPVLFKTISSAVVGAGYGWKRHFVNRSVSDEYGSMKPETEMKQWLSERRINPSDTVAMMTSVHLRNHSRQVYDGIDFSLMVVVTAGVHDAVDVSKAIDQADSDPKPGTINGWVFIDGMLSEEAFLQAIMTVAEAKTKALQDLDVNDPATGTIATGTATDSLLVGSSQRGMEFHYAGSATSLGKRIARMFYECTVEAIKKGLKRS